MEDIDSLKVRLRRFRSAQGELVYVHGLGESSLCFEELIQRQESQVWNHWAPDLPGYGRSPHPRRPLTLDEQADALNGWIQHAGIRKAVVIGHSMGGVLGQIFCERFPNRVQGFINVEGNITLPDCTLSSKAARCAEQEFLQIGFAKLLLEVTRIAQHDAAFAGYRESLKLCDPGAFYLNSRELVELSDQGQMAARLAKLQSRFPVLYVAGSPGGADPASLQLLRTNGVPVEVIAPSGHWPFLDRPEVFVRTVERFLSKL